MDLVVSIDNDAASRKVELSKLYKEDTGELDLSNLKDYEVAATIASMGDIEPRVKSITLSHCKLSAKPLISVLSNILQDRQYRNLKSLDISYCNIPELAFNYLCEYVNPFSGGYNINVLNVARCDLGIHGIIKLLTALFANNAIEELVLTGNHCGDKAIAVLIVMLTKYENKISTLFLGANNITAAGVRQLCHVLESPKQPLRQLYLNGNTSLGDDVSEDLIVALNKGSSVTTLSLSNTSLHHCEWARYLPFMTALHTLDLSFNLIDDDEFGKLCKALERTYCLNHLDLSFNRFGGIKCNVIEQLVASNGALLSLSLSGNRCEDSVWTALHRGLLANNTLLTLNLQECNISLKCALEICKCFCKNDIVSIDFSNNPLPEALIADSRGFASSSPIPVPVASSTAKTAKSTGSIGADPTSAGSHIKLNTDSRVLPLNPAAHALSTARCRAWTASIAQEVTMSMTTLNIVANRTAAMKAKEMALQKALESPQKQHSLSVSAENSNNKLHDFSSARQAGSTLRNDTENNNDNNNDQTDIPGEGLSLTSPALIAQSEHYLSPAALQQVVAQSDLANTSVTQHLLVAYGRAPLLIGHIEVTSLTTYAQAMDLVHPLVVEYVSTIAANETVHNELISRYSLMDPAGQTLSVEEQQLRRVWPELCEQPEPVLVVRPGNWIKLS